VQRHAGSGAALRQQRRRGDEQHQGEREAHLCVRSLEVGCRKLPPGQPMRNVLHIGVLVRCPESWVVGRRVRDMGSRVEG
jgi:hypothetical protein